MTSTNYSLTNPATIAAVEAGGTSFKVCVCHVTSLDPSVLPTVVHRLQVDSSHDAPFQTLEECAAFLQKHKPLEGYHALGIASFGPLGVHAEQQNSNYGHVLPSSPKAAWRGVDLLTPLVNACQGSLPLQIKVETQGAIVLAQSALLEESNSSQDNKEEDTALVRIKQEAFYTGLWNGALMGMVGTALFCKYWWLRSQPRR